MKQLWLELAPDGTIQRCSEELVSLFASLNPPVVDLRGMLERRFDVQAAVERRAGVVRFGLGRGAGRVLFDVDITPGSDGAHLRFQPVSPSLDEPTLGRLLVYNAGRSTDACVIADPDGAILWANVGFTLLLGYNQDEVIGRLMDVFFSRAMTEVESATYWRRIIAAGSFGGRTAIRRSDGVEVPVSRSVSAVRDERGRTVWYITTLRDVTYDQEIERLRSVQQASMLLSRFTDYNANQVNDIATEVMGLCERALLSDDPASAGDALDRIQKLSQTLGALGKQMLVFSQSRPAPGPTDLGHLTRQLAEVLQQGARHLQVQVQASDRGPWADCQPHVLRQISMQLILRTLEVVADGATIDLAARIEDDEAVLSITYPASTYERAVLTWLFPDGSITGPLVHALLGDAHRVGLRLWHTLAGEDRVKLNISAPLAEVAAPVRPLPRVSSDQGWERVLVVEDNDLVRELIDYALRPLFRTCTLAADAQHGWQALEEGAGAFDLLILDFRLPDQDGLELVARVRQRWPRLRILMVSGAAPDGLTRLALTAGVRAVLPKPFRPSELRALVRSVMMDAAW